MKKKLLSLISLDTTYSTKFDELREEYDISFLSIQNQDLYVRLGVSSMKGDTDAIRQAVCKLESMLRFKYDALLIGPNMTPLASSILMKEFSMGSWPKGKLIYLNMGFLNKPLLSELALRTEYSDDGELRQLNNIK